MEIVFAVVIVATAVGGYWALTQPPLSPAPSASPSPSLTASTLPSGAVVVPSPSVAATPFVLDSTRVVDAFLALIAKPGPTYHVRATGRSVGPGLNVPFTLVLDVSEDDFVGTNDARGDGSGFANIVRLDGLAYVRPKGGAWEKRRTDDPIFRQFPFLGVEGSNDLQYVETFMEGEHKLHRIATTKYYQPSVARLLDLPTFQMNPDLLAVELILSDAGIPLRATVRVEAGGQTSANKPVFLGKASYRFTKWGVAVKVKAPVP